MLPHENFLILNILRSPLVHFRPETSSYQYICSMKSDLLGLCLMQLYCSIHDFKDLKGGGECSARRGKCPSPPPPPCPFSFATLTLCSMTFSTICDVCTIMSDQKCSAVTLGSEQLLGKATSMNAISSL